MPKRLARILIPLAIATSLQPAAAQNEGATTLPQWFARPAATRGAPPVTDAPLSRAEAEAKLGEVFAALIAGSQQAGLDTLPPLLPNDLEKALLPSELHIGDFTMPFVLLTKGEKPASGWPLYLCLHGGGGNGDAKGPHEWDVNSREWQAQKTLWKRIYPAPGLYFIPRMADDRKGRWYLDHNQIAFEELITKCILFREVDPNRVYLMGISEGGYGAIRFAGNRPDRFAATGGMAAAEPLSTSPPENMRNVSMRIDIGEKDTMYDRVGLARRMGERLAELKREDPSGFDFEVCVQAGRGHGIDYSLSPQWLSTRVRNPHPDRVVWTVQKFESRRALQNYWLALDAAPATMPLYLSASISKNRLVVTAEQDGGEGKPRLAVREGVVRIRLNDQLADLDAPITIVVNGAERTAVRVQRSLAVMARTMAERSDPNYCFCAEIVIELGAK